MLRAVLVLILAGSIALTATVACLGALFLAFAWNQVILLLFAVAMLGVVFITVILAVRGLEEPQPWEQRISNN
ncbi:MAG: hypothetical protein EXR62_02050 [Chloroflexi bacterium]|nr:hypothetical protein [Chloroflexota bacterium]